LIGFGFKASWPIVEEDSECDFYGQKCLDFMDRGFVWFWSEAAWSGMDRAAWPPGR
jgi:hypothetical protein